MKFSTEDSGSHKTYPSGMRRDNASKARFDLLVPENVPYEAQFLTRCAELMMRGAVKYHDRNWELASGKEELSRMKESAFRHFMQWFTGVDDGEDHAAAVFFNLMAYETTRYKIDNRED